MFCLLLNHTPTSAKNRLSLSLSLSSNKSVLLLHSPTYLSSSSKNYRKKENHTAESEKTRNINPRMSAKVHSEIQAGVFLKGLLLINDRKLLLGYHKINFPLFLTVKMDHLWPTHSTFRADSWTYVNFHTTFDPQSTISSRSCDWLRFSVSWTMPLLTSCSGECGGSCDLHAFSIWCARHYTNRSWVAVSALASARKTVFKNRPTAFTNMQNKNLFKEDTYGKKEKRKISM